ncbi:hypothetical protein [Clostridium ihumii]|nr:hypothetical protein [Clostridium ihumii]
MIKKSTQDYYLRYLKKLSMLNRKNDKLFINDFSNKPKIIDEIIKKY